MRTKQVLIVHSPYQTRGGEERHVDTLSALYEAEGWKITRIPSAEKPNWKEQAWDRVHAHRIFPDYGVGFLEWMEMLGKRNTQRILTIHNRRIFCTNGLASRQGQDCLRCLAKPKWIPLLLNCNSDYSKTAYYTWMLNRIRRRDLWNRAFDRFVVPSTLLLEQAAQSGLSHEKLVWVPHSIDFPKDWPQDRGESTGGTPYDLVYAGRFSAEKGSALMLKLIPELPHLKWLFLCSPDSPDLPGLLDLARTHPVTVRTDSTRANLWSSIGQSKIALAPSTVDESFGLFIAEAMAVGRPVLIPERDGMSWWTQPPYLGIAVPEGLENWVRAIREALNRPRPPMDPVRQIRKQFSGRDYLSKIDYGDRL